jgi:hypothetical protein
MRALIALAALALGSFRASAQATPAPVKNDTAALAQEIAKQRAAGDTKVPDADKFTFGNATVPEDKVFEGSMAVARGNLDVYGTVKGDVVVIDGDIRVHRGARITGDAYAAAGTVIIEGGIVEGTKRAFSAHLPAAATRPSRPLTTFEAIKLAIGWFALLMIIGLGVMIFAEGNIDGTVLGLEKGFAKSFWIGLAGQVLLLPIMITLIVALAITVIGALLIPFAIVAYVIAAAGLVTLGFLAVARLTGGAFASDRGTTSPRGVHLRALFLGLVVYLGLWLLAAAFTWSPMFGSLVRALAIAVTWVAATVGLGAAIVSRGGTVRPGNASGKSTTDEFAWQTPTPVAGVAAATRKVAASR